MVVKLFNVDGNQFLGVQSGDSYQSTEIRKVNADGSTSRVARKEHWGPNTGHTEKSIVKYVYGADGKKNQLAGYSRDSFCFFTKDCNDYLMQGILDREGKLASMLEFNPDILSNPEILTNNAKRVFKKIISDLVKSVK